VACELLLVFLGLEFESGATFIIQTLTSFHLALCRVNWLQLHLLFLGRGFNSPLRHFLDFLQPSVNNVETALHVDLHHAVVVEVLGLGLVLHDVFIFNARV
jgi:hypothetical protein